MMLALLIYSYQRAVEIREQLRLDIGELLAQAETADAEEKDNQKLPEQIARREKLANKMERAIEELEAKARQRQQKAEGKYEEKKAERREKEKKTGKKCTGREPNRPDKNASNKKAWRSIAVCIVRTPTTSATTTSVQPAQARARGEGTLR